MSRILLINPWITDFAAYDFWMKPLGLLHISNVLQGAGCDVQLLDCLDRFHPSLKTIHQSNLKLNGTGTFYKDHITKPDCLKHIPRYYSRYGLPYGVVKELLKSMTTPDLIMITSGMTYWYPGIVQIIHLLKEIFPEIPRVLGGIYATLCPDHAKTNCDVDVVYTGEIDHRFTKLIHDLLGIKLSFETDHYISPDYGSYQDMASVALMTSKGCPFHCPYCATHLIHQNFIQYPATDVFHSIERLYNDKKVIHFAFYDDALLVNKEYHLIPLLEMIKCSGLPIHFHTPNGIHPKYVDQQLAKLFYQCGFLTLRLSFETCNKERQKLMGFKVSTQDLNQAAGHLINAGFELSTIAGYVLMGLPNQDVFEVVESIQTLWDLGMCVSMASFSPIPGTRSWEEAIQTGLISRDIDPLLTNNSIFPLHQNFVDYNTYQDLGTLVSEGNQLLRKGFMPSKQDCVKDRIREVLRMDNG